MGLSVGVAHPAPLNQKAPVARQNITGIMNADGSQYTPFPTPKPTPTPTVSSGSGYDPAATAQAADLAKANADYAALKGTTYQSLGDTVGQGAATFKGGIQDYLDSERLQQNKINNDIVQNELSKMQASRGILDMVGRGIRSGGVVLANKNASTSSAGERLAKAYGDIGRRQESGVNLDYAKGSNSIKQAQDDLFASNATEARHIKENKSNIINSIVNQAMSKITALNQAAASASLPDRINVEQEVAKIKADALKHLTVFDSLLSSSLKTQGPMSAEDGRTSASRLLSAGTAPDNSFDFTTSVPAQFQDTGPFSSELPIFTLPQKKQQTA